MPAKTPPNKVIRNQKVIPAPTWLECRMERLRRMPPPTLKEVSAHLKASAAIRKRLTAKQAAPLKGESNA
jgi:hypothetical protein